MRKRRPSKEIVTFKVDGIQVILNFYILFGKKKFTEVAGLYNLIGEGSESLFSQYLIKILTNAYRIHKENPRIELRVRGLGWYRKKKGYHGYTFEPLFYRGINKPWYKDRKLIYTYRQEELKNEK